MTIAENITAYIAKIGRIPANEMKPEMKVYDSGIISSLKLIELMSHIEKTYAITIRPEELVESNFRDIGTIVGFVQSKVGEKTGNVA